MSTPQNDSDARRFKFDMTFNIAHILTVLGLVYAAFSFGSELKSAQAVQESKIQNIIVTQDRDRLETLQTLRDINKKLDDMRK